MITLAAQNYRHLMRKSVGDPLIRMIDEIGLGSVTGYDMLDVPKGSGTGENIADYLPIAYQKN